MLGGVHDLPWGRRLVDRSGPGDGGGALHHVGGSPLSVRVGMVSVAASSVATGSATPSMDGSQKMVFPQ